MFLGFVCIYFLITIQTIIQCLDIAKLSLAQAPAGLSSIIITVGHPSGQPAIRKSIIFRLGPCWAVAWLCGSYFSGQLAPSQWIAIFQLVGSLSFAELGTAQPQLVAAYWSICVSTLFQDGQLVGCCHIFSRYMIQTFQYLFHSTGLPIQILALFYREEGHYHYPWGATQTFKKWVGRIPQKILFHIEHPCHSIFLLKLFIQGFVGTITKHYRQIIFS